MHHNYFEWNYKKSLDFGIYITNCNSFDSPEFDTTKIEIPGRNGALIRSNNRFKNFTVQYTCAVKPLAAFVDYNEQISAIKAWLINEDSQILVDSRHPNKYRLATITGNLSFVKESLVYTFTVGFDCQPQLFYNSGTEWLKVGPTSLKLINPSNYVALPKIVISGNTSTTTLPDTITIDNITYSFDNWNGTNSENTRNYLNDIIIDCELQNVWLSDGTLCNRYFKQTINGTKSYPSVFLSLGAEEHTISHSGNCAVKIQPRWWTI